MRVAYITMSFPVPSEPFAASDVRALRRMGVHVEVHALRGADAGARRMLAERGLDDLPLTHGGLAAVADGARAALRRPLRALSLLGWVVQQSRWSVTHLARALALAPRCLDVLERLERSRPDVVHLFWGHYPSILGHLARRYLPGTICSTFLGAYDLARGFAGSAAVAREADVVWTHARLNVPAIEEMGVARDRIRVAYRGIDIERFDSGGIAKEPRRLVTAARLIPSKGVDAAIDVFHRVHRRWPDASLVVMGDGPERARLEARARALGVGDAVRFAGHVPHDRVRDEMGAAEVALLMSWKDTERLPNAVKEAMAMGCLPVVARTPGIEELVRDGEHGFVVEPGALDDAAARIGEAFADTARTRAMTERARRHVLEHFEAGRSMRLYVARWTELRGAASARATIGRPVPVLAAGA